MSLNQPQNTFLLGALVLGLAGCSAPATPAQAPVSEPPPVSEPTAIIAPQAPQAPPTPGAVAQATSPYAIALSVADTLPPLPKSNVKRYRSWRQQGRIRVGESHLSIAEISEDETYLIAQSQAEATVRIYERATKKLIGNYSVDGFVPGEFMRGSVTRWPGEANGGPAFLVGNTKGLALYSMLDGTKIKQLADHEVWDMRWSADGRHLICTLSDTNTQRSVLSFYERDGETITLVAQLGMPERVDGVVLSRDKTQMAITNYPSNTIELFDLKTGASRWKVPAPEFAGAIDFSPDGSRIAVGGAKVVLLDVADPKRQSVFDGLGNNAHRVRFSPSGDALAVSAYDGHLRILSAELTSAQLSLLKDLRHKGTANVYAVRFLADGSGVISSSGDRTIRYWGR